MFTVGMHNIGSCFIFVDSNVLTRAQSLYFTNIDQFLSWFQSFCVKRDLNNENNILFSKR